MAATGTPHTEAMAQCAGECGVGQDSSFIGAPATSAWWAVPVAPLGSVTVWATARCDPSRSDAHAGPLLSSMS